MASFGLINIAHCFSFDFPKDNPTHLLDGIRPYSKSGTELCKAILTSQLLDPPGLSGMIHARHSLEILAEKCSWNTPSNIADNLIHMHCNRLLGTSPSLEQKARVAAAYFIEKATFQLQQKNYENRAHLP